MNPIIKAYQTIYHRLEDRQPSGDGKTVAGWLQMDNKTLEILTTLEEAKLTTISYATKINNERENDLDADKIAAVLQKSEDVQCQVDLVTHSIEKQYAISKDWNTLLANEFALRNPITSLFFTTSGESLHKDDDNPQFQQYCNAQKAVGFIQNLAKKTQGGERTIFYHRALVFTFALRQEDLNEAIDVTVLDKLLRCDLHKEAMSCLICRELVKLLQDIPEKQRLSHFISHFNGLVTNVQLSYQTYVENYSFDKIRKEYQERKTQYIKKIQDIFDGISTKVLAMPAGVWFATTQITHNNPNLDPLTPIKNASVLGTIVIMTVILLINTYGGFTTLETVKQEYRGLFDNLTSKFADEVATIKQAQVELDHAAKWLYYKIWLSMVFYCIPLGITTFLYLHQ